MVPVTWKVFRENIGSVTFILPVCVCVQCALCVYVGVSVVCVFVFVCGCVCVWCGGCGEGVSVWCVHCSDVAHTELVLEFPGCLKGLEYSYLA